MCFSLRACLNEGVEFMEQMSKGRPFQTITYQSSVTQAASKYRESYRGVEAYLSRVFIPYEGAQDLDTEHAPFTFL